MFVVVWEVEFSFLFCFFCVVVFMVLWGVVGVIDILVFLVGGVFGGLVFLLFIFLGGLVLVGVGLWVVFYDYEVCGEDELSLWCG